MNADNSPGSFLRNFFKIKNHQEKKIFSKQSSTVYLDNRTKRSIFFDKQSLKQSVNNFKKILPKFEKIKQNEICTQMPHKQIIFASSDCINYKDPLNDYLFNRTLSLSSKKADLKFSQTNSTILNLNTMSSFSSYNLSSLSCSIPSKEDPLSQYSFKKLDFDCINKHLSKVSLPSLKRNFPNKEKFEFCKEIISKLDSRYARQFDLIVPETKKEPVIIRIQITKSQIARENIERKVAKINKNNNKYELKIKKDSRKVSTSYLPNVENKPPKAPKLKPKTPSPKLKPKTPSPSNFTLDKNNNLVLMNSAYRSCSTTQTISELTNRSKSSTKKFDPTTSSAKCSTLNRKSGQKISTPYPHLSIKVNQSGFENLNIKIPDYASKSLSKNSHKNLSNVTTYSDFSFHKTTSLDLASESLKSPFCNSNNTLQSKNFITPTKNNEIKNYQSSPFYFEKNTITNKNSSKFQKSALVY